MIPKLNWNRKNVGKIILFHEFNHLSKPIKKVKNNQFNVKWFFNRFLFSYYQRNSLSFIENRLDLILFRTNLFISYNHVHHAILTGKIDLNNKIVKKKNIFIKKGDIKNSGELGKEIYEFRAKLNLLKNKKNNNKRGKYSYNFMTINP